MQIPNPGSVFPPDARIKEISASEAPIAHGFVFNAPENLGIQVANSVPCRVAPFWGFASNVRKLVDMLWTPDTSVAHHHPHHRYHDPPTPHRTSIRSGGHMGYCGS